MIRYKSVAMRGPALPIQDGCATVRSVSSNGLGPASPARLAHRLGVLLAGSAIVLAPAAARAEDAPPDRHGDTPPNTNSAASSTTNSAANGPAHDAALAPTQLRVALGTSVAQRQLSYDLRGGFFAPPPAVTTTGGSVRLEAEAYPFAMTDPHDALSNFGMAVVYDKTFGVGLEHTGKGDNASIDQSYFALGARYRFALDRTSTLVVGLDYVTRQYLVDRSAPGPAFDVPDVDYSALAPKLLVHVPVTPSVALFASLDTWLFLGAGMITDATSYGQSSLFGIEATSGVELALSPRLSVHAAVEYSQVNLSFHGNSGMSSNRDGDPATQDIRGATDRSVGVAATLGLAY
jgi:opacity protein-like surface antigen